MAISETDLYYWTHLHRAFALTDIKAVCDLGQQDVQDAGNLREIVRLLAKCCGSEAPEQPSFTRSADLWRALGRRVVSLDITGSGEDFRFFDLNFDVVPLDLAGQFEFVTNCGTTEHVIGQLNAFRAIHDLTRPGGVMYHQVPIAGHTSHGLVNYNLKFFGHLAAANGYHCLDAFVSVDPDADRLDPGWVSFLTEDPTLLRFRTGDYPWNRPRVFEEQFRSTDAALRIFLRKSEDAPFRAPVDAPAGVTALGDEQGRLRLKRDEAVGVAD